MGKEEIHYAQPASPFFYESQHGLWPVAGVDEVGRGAWAGPVIACAVILHPLHTPPTLLACLKDSKTLSPFDRQRIASMLLALPPAWCSIGISGKSAGAIDTFGIAKATFLAMEQALAKLSLPPIAALVDGKFPLPQARCPTFPLVRGDALSPTIAAASILAKVWRDCWMRCLSIGNSAYTPYGWCNNKGYGTSAHRKGLHDIGISPHHRLSFAPMKHWG